MDEFILFLQIMLINILLSGDNAVVIALASKNLPPAQQKKAVWWGAGGAVALRLVLTVVAVILLDVPFIQAIGALLLFYIAVKLLAEEGNEEHIASPVTLRSAIQTIIVADIVMSLDNVLAIAAVAEGDYAMIILGITLSIPLIVWGSGMIMKLLQMFPILTLMGAGILGFTAGEMFVGDPKVNELVLHHNEMMHLGIPIGLTVIILGLGLLQRAKWIHIT
ncbi:membrane protein [Paenibacillus swuensis]|uniref:Membrane protein n=1 Tax=Paenibacillus swuensis TaxID=1178515 RepID=A0A172TJZ0_9BACL|nr:TerC family protein [Paenibacillus swuensis]ANE47340.1 membrane protein [Paenibacillus swuensis]